MRINRAFYLLSSLLWLGLSVGKASYAHADLPVSPAASFPSAEQAWNRFDSHTLKVRKQKHAALPVRQNSRLVFPRTATGSSEREVWEPDPLRHVYWYDVVNLLAGIVATVCYCYREWCYRRFRSYRLGGWQESNIIYRFIHTRNMHLAL
ncbi:hypothetical protein ABT56_22165 [Photobacterium aquae]|uniref:Lipoprotein n=1 Tax=Photobacterium aquae TaxID=1195763 RepID=A0A0J1GPV7_9GAMM|nr:hypothetical protein [Photobacterium aquae]KLV01464.1 hypothetical protein ABT56_22165 [Photobacterium aquae]